MASYRGQQKNRSMTSKILAVSGGVDSVVLLDKLVNGNDQKINYIVAHFDHGIRADSLEDARFVEGLAKSYGLEFVTVRAELGSNASEELARDARYEFLFDAADRYDAVSIVSAHHLDDMVGSMAINIIRGTSWRGVSVLARRNVERPLLAMKLRKSDIYSYALKNRLEWVEDHTNSNMDILRNSLRANIHDLDNSKVEKLYKLRDEQISVSKKLDSIASELLQSFGDKRYPYIAIDQKIANELLRYKVQQDAGKRPTRIDADRLLLAIKTMRPGKNILLADRVIVRFLADSFVVELVDQ
jgi:tRNA(Ile)-lysidine synthase